MTSQINPHLTAYLRDFIHLASLTNQLQVMAATPYRHDFRNEPPFTKPAELESFFTFDPDLIQRYSQDSPVSDDDLLTDIDNHSKCTTRPHLYKILQSFFDPEDAQTNFTQFAQAWAGIVNLDCQPEFDQIARRLINRLNQFTNLKFTKAKLQYHQITPHLIAFMVVMTTSANPLLVYYDLSTDEHHDQYQNQKAAGLKNVPGDHNNQARDRFANSQRQFLFLGLNDDFTPQDPHAFWQHIIAFDDRHLPTALNDLQINLLNQQLSLRLKALMKVLTADPDDLPAHNSDHLNSLTQNNIIEIKPQLIPDLDYVFDVNQDAQHKYDHHATNSSQQIADRLKSYPQIMQYLSSFIS